MNQRTYPRYFTRVGGFTSDALYVRFDSPEADAVVVTPTGERQSNHGFWPLENCLVMVDIGHARELSAEEAKALRPNGAPQTTTRLRDHGVTDDDGNLLIGQRGDGSPIWNDPENPLPLQRVAHFTEDEARQKMWELAGAGYGPTGLSKLHHSGIPRGVPASDGRQPE